MQSMMRKVAVAICLSAVVLTSATPRSFGGKAWGPKKKKKDCIIN